MFTEVLYVISWVLVFLLLGAVWYVIDRRLGVKVQRWFYNMTHKDPLPASEERGFIYRRKAKTRFAAATLLASIMGIATLLQGEFNPFLEVMAFILVVPVIMTGFYFGPQVDRFWERKDDILDKVDKIESGEISMTKELKEASHKAAVVLRETLGPAGIPAEEGVRTSPVADPVTAQAASVAEPVKQEPEPSPRDLMNRYLKRD